MKKSLIIAGTAGVFVLGSAALATTALADSGEGSKESKEETQAAGEDGGKVSAPEVSADQAAQKAADEVEKALVTSIELDGKADSPQWEVELVTADQSHDVIIDASDGSVASHDTEDETDDYKEAQQHYDKAKIDIKQASDAALKEVDGTVTDVELGDDDADSLSWEVTVVDDKGASHEVLINADDGSVLEVDTDDEDGDDEDGDDDQNDTDDEQDDDSKDNSDNEGK